MGSKLLFVGAFCIILSMYGGGFATVPAYLAVPLAWGVYKTLESAVKIF
jgi:hypothetical protein